MEHDRYMVVVATDASAAMRFAMRDDVPADLGPPADPARYKPGARRWGFPRREPSRPAPAASPPTDRLLARVRKLLTLAGDRGATEGEASNAAAAAQRLIEEHRLDAALLDAGPADEPHVEEPIGIDVDPIDRLKSRVAWRGSLASGIAEANGCKIYWQDGREIRCIGAPSRVAVVRTLYAWLSREVDRLGSEAARGRGRAYGHAWRVGCAERLAERLAEAAKQGQAEARASAEARAAGSEHALVCVQRALARLDHVSERERVDAWQRANKKLKAGRRTFVRSPDGYSAGRAAGDRVRFDGHVALGRGTLGNVGSGS